MELNDIAQAQIEAAVSLADVSKEFAKRSPQPLGYSLSMDVRLPKCGLSSVDRAAANGCG
jgi:hypothetical protein